TRPTASVAEHVKIVEAVLAGDEAHAVDLMTEHLEAGKRRILNPSRFPVS
ncbi:MAG: hypothetical protein B7Z55_15395, partial [Planctomycetales bacterium 12-60-4]